jgi:hypothetical protein
MVEKEKLLALDTFRLGTVQRVGTSRPDRQRALNPSAAWAREMGRDLVHGREPCHSRKSKKDNLPIIPFEKLETASRYTQTEFLLWMVDEIRRWINPQERGHLVGADMIKSVP